MAVNMGYRNGASTDLTHDRMAIVKHLRKGNSRTRNCIVSVDHPDLDDPRKEIPRYAVISIRHAPLTKILSFHSSLLSRRISLNRNKKRRGETHPGVLIIGL